MPEDVGHVLELDALDVLEHQVGDQARVGHAAGPQVDVEEAVVVDVAEVAAHRRHRPGRARPRCVTSRKPSAPRLR